MVFDSDVKRGKGFIAAKTLFTVFQRLHHLQCSMNQLSNKYGKGDSRGWPLEELLRAGIHAPLATVGFNHTV